MRNRGFTLIELLVVLAILGILVGIVAMNVGGLTTIALKRALESEWNLVTTAIDAYDTQDVPGGTGAAIAEQTDFVKVTAATSGFNRYVKRETKFYYIWAADGAALNVRDRGDTTWRLQWNGSTYTTPAP